ncbi:lipopolysaccharide transport periplasmic protein LptA [Balneatrix alpica]|uniref:Lipopolysaccharide export system protein LptA n=1 Tax=Balneatrix alpica TaxID=75684 RepID=A0ABV5Z8Z8_9GAMM|nr:lipopolysaccharide transport periplasmic protein LptA [Balneatrix alpica]
MKLNTKALGLLLGLLPALTQALPEDREQPVHITADQAALDDAKGIVTYTGNVLITQGSLKIEADKAVLYLEQGELVRAEAFGKPAHYQQQPKAKDPLTHAYGDVIEYKVKEDTLTANGQAKLTQNQDTFTGARIHYDIAKGLVNAYSGKQSGQRVEMVLQPKKKN